MLRLGFFILFIFGVVFGAVTAKAATETLPAAVTVSQGDVESAVARELMDKGAGEQVRVTILGNRTGNYYEGTQHVIPTVAGLTFDKQTTRFSANLMIVGDGKVLTAVPIAGRYQLTVALPVLKRQLRSGDQITEADLDFIDFPLNRMRSDIATDGTQLIGQTPRATISANRPVRTTELSAPAAIRKNALIVMRYKSPTMEISTSGQAMTNGAPGDVIEVRNLISRQIVRAVVENSNTVSVASLAGTAQLAGDPHAAIR